MAPVEYEFNTPALSIKNMKGYEFFLQVVLPTHAKVSAMSACFWPRHFQGTCVHFFCLKMTLVFELLPNIYICRILGVI